LAIAQVWTMWLQCQLTSVPIFTIKSIPAFLLVDLSAEAQEEILEALNSIRRNVTPPASNMLKMKWSKKASENAKKWVSQCRFRNSPQEARTTNFACGESLAQIKIAMSWSKVIATWISTKTYFKYGIGPTDPKKNIYTYTQIVWYNSHMVGCALAYCPQNTFSFMYACHFCPGGNNQEKITTPYKEGPSCADCPQHCEDKLCSKLLIISNNSSGYLVLIWITHPTIAAIQN
uniref:SCP domain-containing protein n=1 Tax=Varanus komodoensis TaxID=61221 RepID=A0A8D2JJ13_VARKO